ncbi:MAG TPA: septal ring lytic transglycosylase RlpA family protein [Verrucomicrobiae bacterium]|nr:septal ring lytic transglycosylase RlpA family protein [Verrucomicrobiae bacterium]
MLNAETSIPMKTFWVAGFVFAAGLALVRADERPGKGVASWYGEEHRGKLMANGKRFNPDKLTAASWFYPLGTKVEVTARSPDRALKTVMVTITDRGPAYELVRQGRIIDLSHAAFKKVAPTRNGLVPVKIRPVR